MNTEQFKVILREMKGAVIEVEIPYLISVIFIGIGISLFLRWFYIRYGKANTNRKLVADSFPLLIVSITLIIYLIKSSLALSLGLVGALSIVRFRAAIKEPEELVYLLFVIALGLGLGAKQVTAVIIIFIVTIVFLYVKYHIYNDENIEQKIVISLSINTSATEKDILSEWGNVVSKYVKNVKLYRLDQNGSLIDATYTIDDINYAQIKNIKKEILDINADTEISIIDSNRDIILN